MTPTVEAEQAEAKLCRECGAFGDMPHAWTENTCLLPHRYNRTNHPPLATTGHCCTYCLDRHREWLTEIVELYATLDTVIEPGSIPDDTAEHGHQKKKPSSPAPMRLEAWAMAYDARRLHAIGPKTGDTFGQDYIHTAAPDVQAVLASWAGQLYEALGWSGSPAGSVAGSANLLSTYANDIAGYPWVSEYDDELRWLRTALRRVHNIYDPRPFGGCLGKLNGDDCKGQVWRDKDDPRNKPMKCDKCSRTYQKLDAVRLAAEVRRKATG